MDDVKCLLINSIIVIINNNIIIVRILNSAFLGIFISFLHPNGAAEATRNIVEGDQILSVNDLSFIDMRPVSKI